MKNLGQFFAFSRERYNVLLRRRAGKPKPWTKDPVLRSNYFCNIFREDDKTTTWFRENIRDPLAGDPKVLFATIAFRWFNLISTGELIKDLLLGSWDQEVAHHRLREKKPLITGAYIIKTPNGMPKLEGLLSSIAGATWYCHSIHHDWTALKIHRLEWMWKRLIDVPFLGPFMAYEVVTDLRYTNYLCDAVDIDTWCSPGPGCARGLGWLLSNDPMSFSYNSKASRAVALERMCEILVASREPAYWPAEWPRWEMREVEHTLCEYDKWRRGKAGMQLKRRYEG